MCTYDYQLFSECGHRVIKVSIFCNPKLWNAGMSGALVSCPEVNYTSLVVDQVDTWVGKWKWVGMKGFCAGCLRVLGIENCPFPQLSYNDELFTLHSFVSGHWSEPFIHLPAITKSVPELVGLARQYRILFPDAPRDEGPELYFKEKFSVYTKGIPINRMQWLRMLNSSISDSPEDVQGRTYKMMGFTEQDLKKIGTAMGKGYKASYIYSMEFQRRGMPRGAFDAMTSKILDEFKRLHAKRGVKFVDNWTD